MAGLFNTLIGGSGIVKITAPLPCSEAKELPIIFLAVTVAKILEPHPTLYGGAIKF